MFNNLLSEFTDVDIDIIHSMEKQILASAVSYSPVAYNLSRLLDRIDFSQESLGLAFELLKSKVDKAIKTSQNFEVNPVLFQIDLNSASIHLDVTDLIEFAVDDVELLTTYANRLRKISVKKQFQTNMFELTNSFEDVEDMLTNAKVKISNLENRLVNSSAYHTLSELGEELLEYLEDATPPRIYKTFISDDFDELLVDLAPSNFAIFGAKPGVSKTSFSLFMAVKNALQGIPSHFFSLEMSKRQLTARILNILTGISGRRILKKEISYDEANLLRKTLDGVKKLPLKLTSHPDMPLSILMQGLRDSRLKFGTELNFIDYIQLVSYSGRKRNEEIAHIAQQLKSASLELDACVVALSQFSRNDKLEPTMDDLKESGDLEQAASFITLMWEELDPQFNDIRMLGIKPVWFKIEKQRNGEKNRRLIAFNQVKMDFNDSGIEPENFKASVKK